MQFREVGGKIQCLVSVYDPSSKRTRQKMVHSMSRYGSNSAPAADAFDWGDDAQRAEWIKEIGEFIDKKAKEDADRSVKYLPRRLESIVDEIIKNHDSQSELLTEDALASIQAQIERLTAAISPKPVRKAGSKSAGRAGFSDEVKDRARELRKSMTVEATRDKLVEEGHAVSKSWVQKWTS